MLFHVTEHLLKNPSYPTKQVTTSLIKVNSSCSAFVCMHDYLITKCAARE